MEGVIGIDEVGRGPLAGPVTVAAVYLRAPEETKNLIFGNTIRDSKKLSKLLRINIFSTIRKNRKNIVYTVSSRSAAYIDRHGIGEAIQACTIDCLKKLEKKGIDIGRLPINLDGGLKIKRSDLRQASFVRGDETFAEIALASIVAKVRRDTYMEAIHAEAPIYDFLKNVGYGTRYHREAIKRFGTTKHHRKSFLKRILTI